MSTGQCTWDHLLWGNIRNYKLCSLGIKLISRGLGHGLILAIFSDTYQGAKNFNYLVSELAHVES
jgi:hypothetical protein